MSSSRAKGLMPKRLYIFLLFIFVVFGLFFSSRKHMLIALLRLEFVVLVLHFPIYFYFCSFNCSLFFVVYFLVFFLFARARSFYLFWFLRFVVMVMIIFNLTVFLNVKVSLFFYFLNLVMSVLNNHTYTQNTS